MRAHVVPNMNKRDKREFAFLQFVDHFLGRERTDKIFSKKREKNKIKLLKTLIKNGRGEIKPVERIKFKDKAHFYNNYVKTRKPVILDGAAKDWLCCKEWSLEYIKELYGEDEIVLLEDKVADNEIKKLADVIDNIRSGGSKYYRFYPLFYRHPERLQDFDIKWLRSMRQRFSFSESIQAFIGGKGTITHLHNAFPPNLFVQVFGEKQWFLYDDYYTPIVDPHPAQNIYRYAPYIGEKPFDPFAEKNIKFPQYKYIHGYEVNLRAGDILWNPPYVWHTVKNVSDSIGVGYRWINPFYCYASAPYYATLDLMAYNPPIWKSIKFYQKDFNLLQLAETGQLKEYLKNKTESATI